MDNIEQVLYYPCPRFSCSGNNALKFKATIQLQSRLGSEQRLQIAGAVTISRLDSPLTNCNWNELELDCLA